MDSLYIVMPAYNEEENIRKVVASWYPILEGKADSSRLVVADFGSTDNTHEILKELKKEKYPKLELLETTNKFHGPKLIALYEYAIKNNADFCFQTDSDGQTNPDEFEAFWTDRANYDGIFGNRTVRGDGKDRALVETVVCLLVRMFFGVKVPDANAPFRLMNCKVLSRYMDRLPKDYNIPNIMITTFFSYYRERCCFREISFRERAGGENSIDLIKIFKIGWNALGDFYKFRKNMF